MCEGNVRRFTIAMISYDKLYIPLGTIKHDFIIIRLLLVTQIEKIINYILWIASPSGTGTIKFRYVCIVHVCVTLYMCMCMYVSCACESVYVCVCSCVYVYVCVFVYCYCFTYFSHLKYVAIEYGHSVK